MKTVLHLPWPNEVEFDLSKASIPAQLFHWDGLGILLNLVIMLSAGGLLTLFAKRTTDKTYLNVSGVELQRLCTTVFASGPEPAYEMADGKAGDAVGFSSRIQHAGANTSGKTRMVMFMCWGNHGAMSDDQVLPNA